MEVEGEQRELNLAYRWELNNAQLHLDRTGAESFLPDGEGNLLTFMPFNGFYLTGCWEGWSTYQDLRYTLYLYEDTTCAFDFYNSETDEWYARYSGTWSEDDGMVYLSLILDDGAHPESPELEYFYGGYWVDCRYGQDFTLTYEYALRLVGALHIISSSSPPRSMAPASPTEYLSSSYTAITLTAFSPATLLNDKESSVVLSAFNSPLT